MIRLIRRSLWILFALLLPALGSADDLKNQNSFSAPR
jgi:hypothetical protein